MCDFQRANIQTRARPKVEAKGRARFVPTRPGNSARVACPEWDNKIGDAYRNFA